MKYSVFFIFFYGCAPVLAFDVAWWIKGDALVLKCLGERNNQLVQVTLVGKNLEVQDGTLKYQTTVRQQQLSRLMHWESRELELLVNLRLAGNARQLQGQLHIKSTKEWLGLLCTPSSLN